MAHIPWPISQSNPWNCKLYNDPVFNIISITVGDMSGYEEDDPQLIRVGSKGHCHSF